MSISKRRKLSEGQDTGQEAQGNGIMNVRDRPKTRDNCELTGMEEKSLVDETIIDHKDMTVSYQNGAIVGGMNEQSKLKSTGIAEIDTAQHATFADKDQIIESHIATISIQGREIQRLKEDKDSTVTAYGRALAPCHETLAARDKTIAIQAAELARLTLKEQETENGLVRIRQELQESDEDKWEMFYKREKELREAAFRELMLKLDLAQAHSEIDAFVMAERMRGAAVGKGRK